MSVKMHDLSREQVENLIAEYHIQPAFAGQNPFMASGPGHEILVSLSATGLYEVELLDKKQVEESLQKIIESYKEYTGGSKS